MQTAATAEEKENILQKISAQQQILAEKLYTLIYSEKIFVYEAYSYTFSDAIKKNQANCMVISELLFQLWKAYTGEALFGATSESHYYSVAQFADGSLRSLDGLNDGVTLYEKKETDYELGEHSKLYQAAILSSKGVELQKTGRVEEAKALYREAIQLAPNNPDYKYNLAILLSEYPESYEEAEKLLREAIRLIPSDPDFRKILTRLLIKKAEHKRSKLRNLLLSQK